MIDSFYFYLIMAYLIGSIPTAVILSKLVFKSDVRDFGSGNSGATNTFRTYGKKAGFVVLIIDILKGVLAVKLPVIVNAFYPLPEWHFSFTQYYQLMLALAVAIGHIYPVFAQFRGGKAVATLLGVMFALDYRVALICLGVFIVEMLIFRIVSLGSMLAAIVFAFAFAYFHPLVLWGDYVLVAGIPALLIFTHRTNIKRLLHGDEPKFGKKKATS